MYSTLIEFKSSQGDDVIGRGTREFSYWCKDLSGFQSVTFWNDGKDTYGAVIQFESQSQAEEAYRKMPEIDLADTKPVIRVVESFHVTAEQLK